MTKSENWQAKAHTISLVNDNFQSNKFRNRQLDTYNVTSCLHLPLLQHRKVKIHLPCHSSRSFRLLSSSSRDNICNTISICRVTLRRMVRYSSYTLGYEQEKR
jgi:hypothetical protein